MLALDHLKVLDVSRGYPPAYSAMFLGDFGAEVIRVDRPEPAMPGLTSEAHSAFNPWQRNKKSVVLNLKDPAGRKVFHRMVETADVVIENNRPGVMKRLGCGYDDLMKINPRLIYCGCSGFGQDGPYVTRPGHDMNYIAIAGALSIIGARDGAPAFPSNFIADMAGCGLHAVIGILTAIIARDKTGKGQYVDISYTDGVMSLMMSDFTGYFMHGHVPKRGETGLTGGMLCVQVYKCKDGEYFTVASIEKHLWDTFCDCIERPDLKDKSHVMGEEKDRIVAELTELFLTKSRDEWGALFEGKEVCVGPVLYVNETVENPQVRHRDMVLEFDHPKVGKVRQIGIPIKLSETPGSVRSLGTSLGSDTDEVLADLGYSQDDIKRLHDQGAMG